MNDLASIAAERHRKLRQKNNIPSLPRQAYSALKSSIKFVSNGFRVVSKEVMQQRKEICDKCEFWDKNAFNGHGRCLKCGCSSAKLKFAHEKCPVGKWMAELT